MTVKRLLEEVDRWKSYGYSVEECIDFLRSDKPRFSDIGTVAEINQVITALELFNEIKNVQERLK